MKPNYIFVSDNSIAPIGSVLTYNSVDDIWHYENEEFDRYMINYHLRKGNIVEYKPNYIFIKPYYISLRDIVEPKDTILEYKHFSDWWESENEVYDSKYINHLINKGYIQEHKPEANHLTFESYLQLLGTDANNASAVNIWKALKYNGYVISKPVIAVDDPPVEKETEEIPY